MGYIGLHVRAIPFGIDLRLVKRDYIRDCLVGDVANRWRARLGVYRCESMRRRAVGFVTSDMLRKVGIFKALRGTDHTPEQQEAIKSLKATLPDGWKFKELRSQLIGRRPVKHETFGAVVNGPDRTIIAVALDGVTAVRAVVSAVPGPAPTSRRWAPPPIVPASREFREPWPPRVQSPEEEQARAAAVALLPEGAVLSPTDIERFGPLEVFGVTEHMPDKTAIAAFGLDPASAFLALAARLRGELPVTEVWFPET